MRLRFTGGLLAAILTIVTACSDEAVVTDVLPVETLALTPDVSSLQLPQGTNGHIIITGNRVPVDTLRVEGVPAGVTATIVPAATQAGYRIYRLAFVVDNSAPLGTSRLTVRSTRQGLADATTGSALTVRDAATGALTIALSPEQLTESAGKGNAIAVDVSRRTYTGPVDLTVTGAPSGVTTSFQPFNPNGTGSRMTLSMQILPSVPPGTYVLTVRANGTGQTESAATFRLNVTAP